MATQGFYVQNTLWKNSDKFNVTHLPLNIFTIKATRKVGLHEQIPSKSFTLRTDEGRDSGADLEVSRIN